MAAPRPHPVGNDSRPFPATTQTLRPVGPGHRTLLGSRDLLLSPCPRDKTRRHGDPTLAGRVSRRPRNGRRRREVELALDQKRQTIRPGARVFDQPAAPAALSWSAADRLAVNDLHLGDPDSARRAWDNATGPKSPALRLTRLAEADLAALDARTAAARSAECARTRPQAGRGLACTGHCEPGFGTSRGCSGRVPGRLESRTHRRSAPDPRRYRAPTASTRAAQPRARIISVRPFDDRNRQTGDGSPYGDRPAESVPCHPRRGHMSCYPLQHHHVAVRHPLTRRRVGRRE